MNFPGRSRATWRAGFSAEAADSFAFRPHDSKARVGETLSTGGFVMSAGDTNTPAAGRGRRNYLINRRFQLRVAAWIALDVFAVCFVGGVLLINVLEPQVRAQVVNPRLAGSPMLTLVGFSFAF